MKTITLTHLEISNFKGISHLSKDFSNNTHITGANGTGKSTIHDAFIWCLFGTNAQGESDFKAQPLDDKGDIIPKIITEVSATIEVDGQPMNIKRRLSQNWVTPRGTTQEILKGSTTDYFIDDAPYQMSEYKAKIDSICSEKYFRLITSTTAFNALNMQERRSLLQSISKEVDEQAIAQDFPAVAQAFAQGKPLDKLKSEASAKKNKAKEELDQIPARIDQQEKLRPVGIDFNEIRSNIKKTEAKINEIDDQLQNPEEKEKLSSIVIAKAERQYKDYSEQIFEIDATLSRIRNDKQQALEREISSQDKEIQYKQTHINNHTQWITTEKKTLSLLEAEFNSLVSDWEKTNEKEFNQSIDPACPHCNKPYTEEEISEMETTLISQFNQWKLSELSSIEKKAQDIKSKIKTHQSAISDYQKSIDTVTKEMEGIKDLKTAAKDALTCLPTVQAMKDAHKERNTILSKQSELSKEIEALKQKAPSTTQDLINKKIDLNQTLKTLQGELSKENLSAQIDSFKNDLLEQSKTLAQHITDMDNIEHQIKQYQKRKIELVEQSVSSLFTLVKFKMYEPNVTNDGEKEKCDCLVGGVPYNGNLNTASKVNAGIDIVNGISNAIGVVAPLFVDNKESVTDLIPTQSQLITLRVVEGQKLSIN